MLLATALDQLATGALRRVAAAHGPAHDDAATRSELIARLQERFSDAAYVASLLSSLDEPQHGALTAVAAAGGELRGFLLERDFPNASAALVQRGLLFRAFAAGGRRRGEVFTVPDEILAVLPRPAAAAASPTARSAPAQRRSSDPVFSIFGLASALQRPRSSLQTEVAAWSEEPGGWPWRARWTFLRHLGQQSGLFVARSDGTLSVADALSRSLGDPIALAERLWHTYVDDRHWSELTLLATASDVSVSTRDRRVASDLRPRSSAPVRAVDAANVALALHVESDDAGPARTVDAADTALALAVETADVAPVRAADSPDTALALGVETADVAPLRAVNAADAAPVWAVDAALVRAVEDADAALVRAAVLEHVERLPPGAWIALDAFAAWLQRAAPNLLREHLDPPTRLQLEGVNWDALELPLVRAVVLGPLYWLGHVALSADGSLFARRAVARRDSSEPCTWLDTAVDERTPVAPTALDAREQPFAAGVSPTIVARAPSERDQASATAPCEAVAPDAYNPNPNPATEGPDRVPGGHLVHLPGDAPVNPSGGDVAQHAARHDVEHGLAGHDVERGTGGHVVERGPAGHDGDYDAVGGLVHNDPPAAGGERGWPVGQLEHASVRVRDPAGRPPPEGVPLLLAPPRADLGALLRAERYLVLEARGRPSRYRLDQQQVSAALAAGGSIDDCARLLRTLTRGSLPEPVEHQLGAWSQRHAALQLRPAVILEARSEAELEELLDAKAVARFLRRRLGATSVEVPAADTLLLVAALRAIGHLPRVDAALRLTAEPRRAYAGLIDEQVLEFLLVSLLAFAQARPEPMAELEGALSLLERLESLFPPERLATLRANAQRLAGTLSAPAARAKAKPKGPRPARRPRPAGSNALGPTAAPRRRSR